jgi:uncharacterized membrane-anchored protein YitT (DUF2179 family)
VRDIIWTIIVIWVIWKIIDMVKSTSKNQKTNQASQPYRKEGEVKIENTTHQKTHFNDSDGEYVDYEEIK